MIKKYTVLTFLLLATIALHAQAPADGRQIQSFDKAWLFYKGDATGADKTTFTDAQWQKVDVPHDWSILGNYDHNNPTGRGGGYLPSGIGWYRKHFEVDAASAKKQVTIEFDGVMANSDVWINGYHLGKRPYGYSSFVYDLTGHLNYGKGKTNILSVRADNSVQPASRYYTGSGIYRHVRLVTTGQIHIDNWGVFVSTPKAGADKATVNVKTTVINQSRDSKNVIVLTTISSFAKGPVTDFKDGTKTVQAAAGKSATISVDLIVNKPELWSTDKPVLYKAVSTIVVDGKTVDTKVTTFGIRTAEFTADQGFVLNGKKLMIKGVCLHHDGGAVGAAVPMRVWERRLQSLKNIGVNGIRTSHNPVAPEFLDLCDRLGFVVMDENLDTWEANKVRGEGGYNKFFKEWGMIDTRDMVMRDRNHPSIVIYSVGNEIHDGLNDSTGFKKYRDLQNTIHENDNTRPVTMALFRPGISKVYTNGFAKMMDVVGQNYRENELVAAHDANPNWKVIGTENGHTLTAWLSLRDHAFVSGQFLWTGVDYLGEADWPNVVNGQGVFDRTGGTRPLTLQRESWWSDKPVVHIARRQENAGGGPVVADWTPADFDTYDDARVSVYSNCDEVELFLNGKSLGSKPKPKDDSPRDWNVTFEKGTIKAVGKNNGKEVVNEELKTAGEPAKILLTVDRPKLQADWEDVAYVTATVVDAKGVPCPMADKIVNFTITGAGVITATDNADLSNQESYTIPVRHTYKGKCIAIIKGSAAGKATIKATSQGLGDGSVTIEVVK
jgi:beta-galactosidase